MFGLSGGVFTCLSGTDEVVSAPSLVLPFRRSPGRCGEGDQKPKTHRRRREAVIIFLIDPQITKFSRIFGFFILIGVVNRTSVDPYLILEKPLRWGSDIALG